MSQPELDPSVYEAIHAGTFPFMVERAIDLFGAITDEAAHLQEPVDFAAPVGLDVGSYDGGFGVVIRELGVDRVISIEPNADAIESGVIEGTITKGDVFHGSLQRWVAAGNVAVNSVFVFNMLNTLPNSPTFRAALKDATAVGGVLVATFREPITVRQLQVAMRADDSGFRRLEAKRDYRPRPREPHHNENKFMQFYRRQG